MSRVNILGRHVDCLYLLQFSHYSQNPSLDLSYRILPRQKRGFEKFIEISFKVSLPQPGSSCIGILLIWGAFFASKWFAPENYIQKINYVLPGRIQPRKKNSKMAGNIWSRAAKVKWKMENFTEIQGTINLIISFSDPGKDASSKHHFPNLTE